LERCWTINGRFLTQQKTGVQRYAHEIVHALDELLSQNHALTSDLRVELLVPCATKVPDLRAIKVRAVGRVGGHLWEQTVLPFEARGPLLNLCNTAPLAKRNQIVCIHDANTRAYPQSYSLHFRALYGALLPALGRCASTIVTVSHYSAGELARYGICSRDRIVVIPNGHEHAARWVPKHSVRTKAVAGPDTIVLVGSTIPHKNVRLIIGMAKRLSQIGLSLAVVGARDASVFDADKPMRAAENISWLGRLSDEELSALLRDSLCLAFPSFVEGFGLPPLEAMAVGCPVVVSDRASMPEICGDAALYASPTNPDDWFESFVRLHKKQDLRAQMIRRGRQRATRFRWGHSAELYLSAMARAEGVEVAACRPGDEFEVCSR